MFDLSAEMAELWTSLGGGPGGRGRAIEFIAARDGEGTSTIAREFAFYAARTQGRRVWLIDLDLMAQTQTAVLERDPDRYGELGPASAASPDGSMFFSVHPPLKRPDGRPWPDARYISAHAVGGRGFWATRFRREALRPRQGVHVVPVGDYWRALRRHSDLVIVDAPAADRSQAGLTVAPFMDDVVLVVAADAHDVRAPAELRDELAAMGARCAGLFVNRVRLDAPAFFRGSAS
ncbi:MAG TPA: sugar kinase [Caulobacteraceae bacterium]|nr:sugar kinase [Caulobacteraceae bacterium]